MMEHESERQRSKEKAVVAAPGKGKPKRGSSGGGLSIRVPRRGAPTSSARGRLPDPQYEPFLPL
jgi:hypothetical protein